MSSQYKINELYNTISLDLNIKRFENEDYKNYKYRVVYSALGKWILSLFSDRDYEELDNKQVSKSHVTGMALSIINAYKKIDQELCEYFIDDSRLVTAIENVYVRTGYINSGYYSFKFQKKAARLIIEDRCLIIDSETSTKKMRGLGIWGKSIQNDINFIDYLIIKDDAKTYTEKIIEKLCFTEFDYNNGLNEIYNVDKKKWEIFSNNLIEKYKYYIVKIDNGLGYKVIKVINSKAYSASLPNIYTKGSNDFTFSHEIWRIILGIQAINNNNAKCYITQFGNDAIKIKMFGYVLPILEDSLLKCMAWPIGNSINFGEYITDISIKKAICKLFKYLSIDIVEE